MSGDFDSRKDSHSTKFERSSQIFVKLSFKELCHSKLFGLYSLIIWLLLFELKIGKNRKVDCEFMRHQFLK